MRTNLARFPFIKGLDSFDFGYQPWVDRKQIQKLGLCHFVEHGENLVRAGPQLAGGSPTRSTSGTFRAARATGTTRPGSRICWRTG